MARLTQHERDILLFNIKLILHTLNCTINNINGKYIDFPIQRTTLVRWLNDENVKPQIGYLPDKLTEFYNQYFEPQILDWHIFITQKLYNIQLKENQYESLLRYQGEYYIYYFSNHYADTIHGGRMQVFLKDKQLSSRLVLGIQDDTQFKDPKFRHIFQKTNTNEEALKIFKEYRKELKTELRKRCYFYEGTLHADEFSVSINFSGVEHRRSHKQTLLLNVKRKPLLKEKSYKGGLGLILAPPNEAHSETRSYKMGISTFCFSLNDNELKELLKLKTNSKNRVEVTTLDDGKWFDLILLREQQTKDLNNTF